MKICLSSTASGPDAPVDPRFGRAALFVLVDTETLVHEVLVNEGARAAHGAGVEAARAVAASGAYAVLTGHCGPKAFEVLDAAGVEVYTDVRGTVRDAVQEFLEGRFVRARAPDVPSGGLA